MGEGTGETNLSFDVVATGALTLALSHRREQEAKICFLGLPTATDALTLALSHRRGNRSQGTTHVVNSIILAHLC